jgi:hypothetical protein
MEAFDCIGDARALPLAERQPGKGRDHPRTQHLADTRPGDQSDQDRLAPERARRDFQDRRRYYRWPEHGRKRSLAAGRCGGTQWGATPSHSPCDAATDRKPFHSLVNETSTIGDPSAYLRSLIDYSPR